jgi:hypothetical protein
MPGAHAAEDPDGDNNDFDHHQPGITLALAHKKAPPIGEEIRGTARWSLLP